MVNNERGRPKGNWFSFLVWFGLVWFSKWQLDFGWGPVDRAAPAAANGAVIAVKDNRMPIKRDRYDRVHGARRARGERRVRTRGQKEAK